MWPTWRSNLQEGLGVRVPCYIDGDVADCIFEFYMVRSETVTGLPIATFTLQEPPFPEVSLKG